MMTSADALLIVSKFCFSGLLGGGGGLDREKIPKMTKNSVSLGISRTVPCDCGFWYTAVK